MTKNTKKVSIKVDDRKIRLAHKMITELSEEHIGRQEMHRRVYDVGLIVLSKEYWNKGLW